MTGQDAFIEAMQLLGYTNDNGLSGESALLKRLYGVVNRIYADLFYILGKENFKPLKTEDNIDLPERILNDCFVYGVAMLLAQGENDSDNFELYRELYYKKRAAASRFTHINDIFGGLGDV